MRRVEVAVLIGLVILPSVLRGQSTPLLDDVVLRPGDAVHLTVWRRPEMTGEFLIAVDSTIAHPLLRQVKVAGVPIAIAEERVGEFLSRLELEPNFVMQPLFRVAIAGEVRQPSLYSLDPAVTVSQAIAMAGGPTERGRIDQVRLRRGGGEILVNLTDPNDAVAQSTIRSGDQILVDRRISFFREYVVPAASVTAAFGTILNLLLR